MYNIICTFRKLKSKHMSSIHSPFPIGSIVALKSHPYTALDSSISFGGDQQSISPLMIIVETIIDSTNLFDENLGFQSQIKGKSSQCKCLWFSTKSNQFEETWLSSNLIKLVPLDVHQNYKSLSKLKFHKVNSNNEDQEVSENSTYEGTNIEIDAGGLVVLITAALEAKKEEVNYSINDNKKNIKSINSFVSPVMQVIGTKKFESKEPRFNSKTGSIRQTPDILFKCKWYNHSSEKFSEKLLPAEALTSANIVNEENLKKLNDFTKERKLLLIKYNNKEVIFLPLNIKYTHGFFHLIGFDYITNKIHNYDISKFESLLAKNDPILTSSPSLNIKQPFIDQIENTIKEAQLNSNYIRIKYRDRVGKVTFRTIKDYQIDFFSDDSTKNSVKYLAGYCLLRNEERHFHLERIFLIEVLNIKF